MKIISEIGQDDIAIVYIGETAWGHMVEFVESVQPPLPREKKWVLIVSTLYGCPVKCKMCDAGNVYYGRITKEDILSQIDYLVTKRFPDRVIQTEKFKIQFARVGEPSFNMNVLDVLEALPGLYKSPYIIPSISTIAPNSTDKFFEKLIVIKNQHYNNGNFQLQFSIHTTDKKMRDVLLPVKKWSFEKIAKYGDLFFKEGDRKIALNFAASNEYSIEPEIISRYFDPSKFLIKITPLNPTYHAKKNKLTSFINPLSAKESMLLVEEFRTLGYEVLVSIGEPEENKIGSNCGQYIKSHVESKMKMKEGYTYKIKIN
ncbi:MAG: radical SAM protein [Ignavibacteriae bacterium]|nr:MAG: radical SAM protein [Ignavibacteriota bacterium]